MVIGNAPDAPCASALAGPMFALIASNSASAAALAHAPEAVRERNARGAYPRPVRAPERDDRDDRATSVHSRLNPAPQSV
jgi:hypothetical protein